MKSIIETLGGKKDFPRVLVGIGRPTSRDPSAVANYVLEKFRANERDLVEAGVNQACDLIEAYLENEIKQAAVAEAAIVANKNAAEDAAAPANVAAAARLAASSSTSSSFPSAPETVKRVKSVPSDN